MIIPWSSLATIKPTASSVRFILDNIAFTVLVAIFCLRDYTLILRLLVTHSLMVLELEPFNLPRWLQTWDSPKASPQPLTCSFIRRHEASLPLLAPGYNHRQLARKFHGRPLIPFNHIDLFLYVVIDLLTCNIRFFLLVSTSYPTWLYRIFVSRFWFYPVCSTHINLLDKFLDYSFWNILRLHRPVQINPVISWVW